MTKEPNSSDPLCSKRSLDQYLRPPLDVISQPPFEHKDTILHCLLLEADRENLQTSVDKLFRSLGLDFEVVGSTTLLTALYIGKTQSMNPDYRDLGFSQEWDLAFWALVEPKGGGDLLWVPIYMFVDSVVALLAGREIYGFPKQMGVFERDIKTLETDASVEVKADVFEDVPYEVELKEQTIVKIRRTGMLHALGQKSEAALSAAAAEALKPLDPEQFGESFDEALNPDPRISPLLAHPPYGSRRTGPDDADDTSIKVPMLFLKQYRDAAQHSFACYRAAIRAEAVGIAGFKSFELLGDYRVDFGKSKSHPIVDDLGLRQKDNKVTRAYLIKQPFIMDKGFEVEATG